MALKRAVKESLSLGGLLLQGVSNGHPGVCLCLGQVWVIIILSKWIRGVELGGEVETAGSWWTGSQQADQGVI